MGTDPLEDAKRQWKDIVRRKFLKINQENQLKKDAFDVYGHGVISYFRFIRILILTFSVISVMIIPLLALYGEGHALGT